MKPTKHKNIFMEKRKSVYYYTKNLVRGKDVYGERLVREQGTEYREWDLTRSKLAAAIAKDIQEIKLGDAVLYLGASTGTTVSHVSDILGKKGIVFAIEFAPRVLRDLVFLAEKRQNIAPILADANQPNNYADKVCECDFLFQDIAQRNQVDIFIKNLKFLKMNGQAMLAVKARSIDVTKNPKVIFEQVKKKLQQNKQIKILGYTELFPYEKDHCVFLCEKVN